MSSVNENPKDKEQSLGFTQTTQVNSGEFLKKFNQEIQSFTSQSNEFPTNGLPNVLLDFAENISKVYGVPIEFPVMSALCAVSAALRKKFSVNNGKYINFPQLWLMFVAPSGIGKTEPMAIAFKTLQRLDKECFEKYQQDIALWKVESAEAKNNKQSEPDKPTFKQCLIDDFTPESMYQTMFINDGAVSIYRDELAGWFADFGRYSKSGEISRYLSIFDNKLFSINRKSEEPKLIAQPFLTICGTIQPQVLRESINGNKLKENGFASRFLYVLYERLKKEYYNEIEPDTIVIETYNELIEHCYNLAVVETPLTLSDKAKDLFIAFSKRMTDLINDTQNPFLRASYSKLEIQVLRIALIIHIISCVYDETEWQTFQITPQAMQYAIDLCNYFSSSYQGIESSESTKQQFSKADAIKLLFAECEINNIQQFADVIGVSRQYVSKLSNNV